MKNILTKSGKTSILIGLTLATVLFFGAEKALAGDNDNISGWAWSENIGWISFNNLNCDPDDNGRSNGLPGCPPAGTEIGRYGVNVDLAGILSGYAWSEHIGWISFNKVDTGNPPALPYNGGEFYIAKIDWTKTPPEVSGWARVMSVVQNPGPAQAGGWDGWIKFRGVGANPGYKTWIDTSLDPAEFLGFAWADDFPVVGWISFNHKNCDPDSDGFSEDGPGCPSADTPMDKTYKVIIRGIANNPPEVKNLKNRELDPCDYGAAFILSWQFKDDPGDSQSAYQVQVDDDSNFLSIDDDSCVPALGTCSPGHNSDSYTTRGNLEYNTTYYWHVKVWDQRGAESEWSEVDSFRTTPHQWPAVNFVWTPARPSIEEYAQFWDQSQVFDNDGPPEITNWHWEFTNGSPPISNEQNPESRFLTPGLHNVTLTVRDQDNFKCEKTKQVPVTPPLPSWREIPPYTREPETFLPLKANFSWQGFRLSRLFAWRR